MKRVAIIGCGGAGKSTLAVELGQRLELRVAEQYVREFGNLAKTNNTMLLPSNLGDVGSMVATIMKTMEHTRASGS